MHGGGISRQFNSWRLRGYPQIVEYSVPIVNGIEAEVVSAYQKFPHGGLAIGGVLFGEGDKHLVRILGARAIPCDHSAGPSFTLSDTDHEALKLLLEECGNDPELEGLVPVGWYHSHTRSGLNFTPSDLEIHQRHFPEPWQIALVLRPDADRPTAAGIFTRREDGGIPAQPAFQIDNVRADDNGAGTLVDPAPPSSDDAAEAPMVELDSAADHTDSAGEEQELDEGLAVPSFGKYDNEGPSSTGRRKVLAGVAAAVILALSLFAAYRYLIPQEYWEALGYYAGETGAYLNSCVQYWSDLMIQARSPALGLRALSNGTDLLIRWDSTSEVLVAASSVSIVIEDRDRSVDRELTPVDVAEGLFHFRRHSGDVRVQFTVNYDGRPPYTEITRFIGVAPIPGASANPEQEYQTMEEARAELERLRTQLLLQAEQSRSLVNTLEALQEIPDAPAAPVRPDPAVAQTPPPAAPPAQVLQEPPAPTPSSSSPPSTPVPAPAPTPEPPKPAAPTSGRILWTGYLRSGEDLTIANGRPSTGSASGLLPGSPVRLSVFPGELTGSGLTIFSNQRRHAGVTEAPGSQNSWNQTTFEYRPGETDAVSVVEMPSEANRWDRLVVRAEGRPLSVIVVFWETTATP